MRGKKVTSPTCLAIVRISSFALCIGALSFLQSVPAYSDTLSEALSRAYLSNPQLRAQRAETRATDENLPQALAGYRPTAAITADGGLLRENYAIPGPNGRKLNFVTHPAGGYVQLSQNLFNGFRTQNQVQLAQSQILSSREALRYAELSVLAGAISAYLDTMRDTTVYELRTSNVRVLERQVEDTKTRLNGGEVTRTDLAQAEAALSQGRIDQTASLTNLKGSIAKYVEVIGFSPKLLAPAKAPVPLLPKTLDIAYQWADEEHPLVLSARHNVDVALQAVRVAEGQLLPSVNLNVSSGPNYNYASVEKQKYYDTRVSAQITVPLYDGGTTYSEIRQAKEKLGQAEAVSDQQRYQVHASVAASFAAWENSQKLVANAGREVQQSEKALAGVREEARLGQRTTFDVLYAQQSLLNARITYVTAQHDRILAAFSLVAATGRLSAETLGLDVPLYRAVEHYDQVKDKWFGTTP
jgi:outer membrane protein